MKGLNRMQSCLIVVGGFINYFLADGYTYSVGVLYSNFLVAFNATGTSASLLPGLLYSIPQFTALFLCPLLDTYGYSSGAAWGAILLTFSCIISAFAPNLQTLYFTLGFLTSIGLQLTYTSAIMAVTYSFKDSKVFGLAVGLAMCGSGIGSFSSNPFVAWLLHSWSWRQVLVIEGGIMLHALIAASCFHHFDAIHFQYKVIVKSRGTEAVTSQNAILGDGLQSSVLPNRTRRIEKLWKLFRFLLFIPSRCRFRTYSNLPIAEAEADGIQIVTSQPGGLHSDVHTMSSMAEKSHEDEAEYTPGCSDFLLALGKGLKQLISPSIWTNPTFLTYVLANGLTGMGIVIPWTFVYDHTLHSLRLDGDLDDANAAQVSWLPSMIGLGSLFGQIFLGILTSGVNKFLSYCFCCHQSEDVSDDQLDEADAEERSLHQHSTKRCACCGKTNYHLFLFMAILLWNSMSTLFLTFLPIHSIARLLSPNSLFFSFPVGIAAAFACFLIGVSNGAIYVMYPLILMDTLGETLWPAGLGLFLVFNGAMNLAGTSIGGYSFDSTNSYKMSFTVAGGLPLIGLLLCTLERFAHFVMSKKTRHTSRRSSVSLE